MSDILFLLPTLLLNEITVRLPRLVTQGQAVKSACSIPGPPSGDIFSSRGGQRSSLLVPFFHCVLYLSRESGTNLSGTLLGTFTRRFSNAFYSYLALKEKASAHLPVSSGMMRELCTSST